MEVEPLPIKAGASGAPLAVQTEAEDESGCRMVRGAAQHSSAKVKGTGGVWAPAEAEARLPCGGSSNSGIAEEIDEGGFYFFEDWQ